MPRKDQQILTIGVLLGRPANKVGESCRIDDTEIVIGGEVGVLDQFAIFTGVTTYAVVCFAFTLTGGFEQSGNGYVLAACSGSPPEA